MDKRWRHRTAAALTAVPLALGLSLATTTTAQASDATYDCESATLHTFLVNRPVTGFPCTGPVGVQPPGSVYDVSTSRWYSCLHLEGMPHEGSLWVFGSGCEEF